MVDELTISCKGGSRSPIGGRQCKFCLCAKTLREGVSHSVSETIRHGLIVEIRRMLTVMRVAQRDYDTTAKQARNVVATWRCEEARDGWGSRVCRNLLGIGQSQSCKQNVCSKMKERLDRHQKNCNAAQKGPGPPPNNQTAYETQEKLPDLAASEDRPPGLKTCLRCRPCPQTTKPQTASKGPRHKPNRGAKRADGSPDAKYTQIRKLDRASSTSTKSSMGISTSRADSSATKKSKSQPSQTFLSVAGNNELERDETNKQANETDKVQNSSQDRIKEKTSEMRKSLLNSNLYSERLHSEIHEFFYDIPVFPNTSEIVKQKRLHIIDNFIDKIADLYVNINDKDYNDKVRYEIDRCLLILPMWEPESERDKTGFKNCLGNSLFEFIKTFNEQWYSFRKDLQSTDSFSNSFVAYNDHMNHILENAVINWVECNLKINSNSEAMDTLLNKIQPILESGISIKHILESAILNIFEEMSPHLNLPRNKMQLNQLASDLANVLSTVEDKNSIYDNKKKRVSYENSIEIFNYSELMDDFEDEIVNQVTDILLGNLDTVLHENDHDVLKEVRRVLQSTGEFSGTEAASLAKTLVTNIKDCFDEDFDATKMYPKQSSSFSVLTSQHEMSLNNGQKIHATPSIYVRKKQIPTRNNAEKLYIDYVKDVVSTWIDTTDVNFETAEGQIFKHTVITEIVNDIHDLANQTVQFKKSGVKIEGKLLKFIIMRAIRRFELFATPVTEDSPQVVGLWEYIMALDTSLLNTSTDLEAQHDNELATTNTNFTDIKEIRNVQELSCQSSRGLNKVEAIMSVWMNEQPSVIFEASDGATRARLLQEVAAKIHEKIEGSYCVTQKTEAIIKNVLVQWLGKIVKPEMRRVVDGLAENLKDRILKLSQDEPPIRAFHKIQKNESTEKYNESKQLSYKLYEADIKVNEFINTFIERNYTINDDVVKGVWTLILKQELLKMSPAIREDLYKTFTNDEFNKNKFEMEFNVVNEVYDWLKKMTFYYSLLKSDTEIIDFVHGLARNIMDIETERVNHPNLMDYNAWLHSEIAVYLLQKDIEINPEDSPKIDHHANELCLRIINLRKDCYEGELNKIIAEHMNKHDALLAKDYLKKILWHRRLGENVMEMLLQNPTASRELVENTLAQIPVPRDESVLKFKMEIKYNITIQDWLHALPLIPPKDDQEELNRKNMIQQLLQNLMKTDERKAENPNDSEADRDLDHYITNWISRLKFEADAAVDVPVLVSQLRSGLEFVKWTEKQSQQTQDPQGSLHRQPKSKDPGEQIVDAIESWCYNLPIKTNSAEATETTKEQIATNMFRIVGSLSGDPQVNNDKQKFQDILGNEIESQLNDISDTTVKNNIEKYKTELLEKIMQIRDTIQDVNSGDDYVQSLENSIDNSLSKPACGGCKFKTNSWYELFKKRMVMLWLLQNYDNAVDFHSLKYKKMLSDEIDLLSEEAQKENIFPANKEEMVNDLTSVFYTVHPPNEEAIIYEIENIKLRCEIESWAKELPLRETFGYEKLLERDQILTILSKILFDIERSGDDDADEKMNTEIIKWSKKLQLLPCENNNLSGYANLLVCLLKASRNSRKCHRQPEPKNFTVVQETLKNLKAGDELNKIRDTLSAHKINQGNTSQVAGPSAPKKCDPECGMTKEKLANLLTEAIGNWCDQLPLQYNGPDERNVVQGMKQQLLQRLLGFVSELHYRPNTLNHEGLYEYYLNNEIENILTQLANQNYQGCRLYWEAQLDRNERKSDLINALKAIRPLVQVEREKEMYKEKLKHTISSFHESMVPYAAVQISKDAQISIMDDFLQYKQHKGDFEAQELYKLKMNETINNELNNDEITVDSLLATNRLISEMSKVKLPIHADSSQRRFSQPNPIASTSQYQPASAIKRDSMSYPLPRKPCRQVPPQNSLHQKSMIIPQPPLYPSRSMPAPASITPSDFHFHQPMPVPAPKTMYERTNDTHASIPFPAPRAMPRRPLEQRSSISCLTPRITPPPDGQPIAHPYPLPRTQVPLELRPFPVSRPSYDTTYNTSYQSPRAFGPLPNAQRGCVTQQNVEQEFEEPAQTFREQQIEEQLNKTHNACCQPPRVAFASKPDAQRRFVQLHRIQPDFNVPPQSFREQQNDGQENRAHNACYMSRRAPFTPQTDAQGRYVALHNVQPDFNVPPQSFREQQIDEQQDQARNACSLSPRAPITQPDTQGRYVTLQNVQPEFDMPLREQQSDEQQNLYQNVPGTGEDQTRTTRVPDNRRFKCPEEQRREDKERRHSRRHYQTCEADSDSSYHISRPYPFSTDNMYY